MIEGVTKKGFNFKVDDEALDDMELFEKLVKMDSGTASVVPDVLERLLGSDQKKALYDFYRDEKTGRVKITTIINVIKEIFAASDNSKKS